MESFYTSKHMKSLSPNKSSIDKDSISILIDETGNEKNPFDKSLSWDDFKKEYYTLEKKIKKSLENLYLVQIEFNKQISLLE